MRDPIGEKQAAMTLEIGDQIQIQGMAGVVVALISEGKFTPEYPAQQWGYLEEGVLVVTREAGLIHYPSLDGIEIVQL